MKVSSTVSYRIAGGLNTAFHALVSFVLAMPFVAFAEAVATPNDYSRTSSFTYYLPADGAKNGLLATETVEPGSGAAIVTTYTYDYYGNKNSATTQTVGTPTGQSNFDPRTSGTNYTGPGYAQITVNGTTTLAATADGLFATWLTNALSQTEHRSYDPRFGAILSLTGPNNLTTSWTVDDFGRKTSELRADGTSTVIYYCLRAGIFSDTSSNNPQCADLRFATNEVPGPAVMFVHSEDRDTTGAKMGPYTRVYSDAFGRTVRTVTESFDGSGQSNTSPVVRDTMYSAAGVQTSQTDPYFLTASDGGGTFISHDVLGRPTRTYVFDGNATSTISVLTSYTSTYVGPYSPRRAAKQTIAYNGLTTTTTNDKGQTRTEQKNAIGEVILVTDALGAQIAYQRDAFGNLIKTVDALGNTIALTYDVRGRKLTMTDPDTGTWAYDYDALGQLVWQKSANQTAAGQPATTMAYDLLGRMTKRVDPEYTSTWTYDNCSTGIGKLCKSTTSNGLTRQVGYDTTGRVSSNRTTVTGGPTFGGGFSYEPQTGRLSTQTYPTGLQVGYVYTARGFLSQLLLKTQATVTPLPATPGGAPGAGVALAANSVLWQAQSVNARGQIEQQYDGNGVVGRASYDPTTGRLSTLSAGVGSATNFQSNVYSWDTLGNLKTRSDANGDGSTGTTENFTYGDNLNRLTQYQVLASSNSSLNRTVNLQYNALGMLLSKDDVGGYKYPGAGAAHPHALQTLLSATANTSSTYTYDANGNMLTSTAGGYRSVSYNSFNLPDSQRGITGASAGLSYTWRYDENHARFKESRYTAQGTRTTWELHPDNMGGLGFESETQAGGPYSGSISQRHYLTAGGQVIGMLVSTSALPKLDAWPAPPPPLASMTLVKVEYWHKDHLGSLAATTDHAGNLTARYAYGPFGKRRNTNGTYDPQGTLIGDYSPATNNGTDRGFTGHEHLDDVGIVHMNGRLFDPKLAVFMQADPMIQDPGNLQSYNRYAYCYNNPLGCNDPSGLSFWTNPISALKYIDPAGYALNRRIASTQTGYTIGSIAIGVASAVYCEAWVGVCNGVGQAAWAGFAGQSFSQSLRTGVIAGATAEAFYAVGSGTTTAGADRTAGQAFANVAGHAAVGCASSEASGGSCGSGALGAGLSAAWGNYGPGYAGGQNPTFDDMVYNTTQSAIIGGTGSVLGGGKFANGAVTGAFGYLFNELLHEGSDRRRAMLNSAYYDGGQTPTFGPEPGLEGVYPEAALLPARGALGLFRTIVDWLGPPAPSAASLDVVFGTGVEGGAHATRWLDARGIDIGPVKNAIWQDLNMNGATSRPAGTGWSGSVNVQGQSVGYSAYRMPDGTINVGSIRPPR